LQPRTRGLLLLGELGCVACHAQGDVAAPADLRQGPDLASLGTRVRGGWIANYLADPLAVAPGTVMPDVLRGERKGTRRATAMALAHYLRSFASPPVDEAVDPAAAARGGALFHSVGCAACHAPRDGAGREVPTAQAQPLGALADKYLLPGLRALLLAPHRARPAARMPDFHLTPAQAHDLASYLLAAPTADAAALEPPLDPQLADAGRTEFAARGCAHCHHLVDPARAPASAAPPLRTLDPHRGCLSGSVGAWPFYALSTQQRADVVVALRALTEPSTAEDDVSRLLASRNCTACHVRGNLGQITAERSALFTSDDASLGDESRVPPALDGVGAKLQRAWLVDAIAHGQTARPYLHTRMPGFGTAFAEQLADLLVHTDTLPPLDDPVTPLPRDEDAARAVIDLGRELAGDEGMNCIACHTFAGERVGAMGAIDLVESTGQRLRPEWFAHFLRTPFRFKPGTLMPQFFPGGVSVRPEVGGGDVSGQIEALWHYLAQGRNGRSPHGMRRPPIELTVGSDAVLLRRKVQHTGKRGISVGYPLGVNLTFDAERLALDQVWWGKFVDAAPVWTGQGNGEARILGSARTSLPRGPALVALPAKDAPWPTQTRRELGQRFLGYDLDRHQRPTFRYQCDGVTIEDTPSELALPTGAAGDRPILRRTLLLRAAVDTTLTLRVARAVVVADLGAGRVLVGSSLEIRVPPQSYRVHDIAGERELRVTIALVDGRGAAVVDYVCREAGK
jgi:mono/diheme cytochrome c family protein